MRWIDRPRFAVQLVRRKRSNFYTLIAFARDPVPDYEWINRGDPRSRFLLLGSTIEITAHPRGEFEVYPASGARTFCDFNGSPGV